MKYKVIKRFSDLEDDGFVYEVGWEYPRANHFVSQARIAELSSEENRQGVPLIEKVGEVKEEVEKPIEVAPVDEIVEEIVEIEEINEEKPKKKKKK